MDAHSSVRGTVHGPVTQFGNVRGDVHISTSPGVSWPVHVGAVPRQADCYQDRPAPVSPGLTVFRGMGGVGKTQTAAHHARASQQDPDVDLVVWITATSREAVVAGYAEAATLLQIATSDADTVVLSWLQTTRRRWLIVLDDVADPSVLRDLWPPVTDSGQTVVTTRRTDSALARTDSTLVDIKVFTPDQSQAYLDAKLAAYPDLREGTAELAQILGHLPLALAQAVAYLIDRDLTCAAYAARFRDQRRKLSALVPEPSALPDDHQTTIDVTWSLSIELANSLKPAGLARPLLQIASLLDPNGIPVEVLTSPPVIARLAEVSGHDVDAEDAADALHCLHRLSLAESGAVHALVQRATRDDLPAEDLRATAQTAADALLALWPAHEGNAPLLPALRANASALTAVALSELLGPDCHSLLFTYGEDLGKTGLVVEAHRYYEHLLDLAMPQLGSDHHDIFSLRNSMATWRGEAGDAAGSFQEFSQLRDDCLRVLGADHPLTLASRNNRAMWRLEAGDVDGATKDIENLLADRTRVLGPDARATLTSRGNLAHCRMKAGDFATAARDYEQLLSDRITVLGNDHPETLITRNNLAACKSYGPDIAGAVADYEALLADQIRVLGPEHPATLTTRHNLAGTRGDADQVPAAIQELEELLEDQRRVLGPVHPDTLRTRGSLAHWRAEAGEVESALEEKVLVVHDCLEALGPLHPITLSSRNDLASLRGTAGDPSCAAEELEKLLTDQEAVLGADHPDSMATRNNLAGNLLDAGDLPGAIRKFEQLVEDQSRVLGVRHSETLRTRNNLAGARSHAGDFRRAIAELKALVEDYAETAGPAHLKTLDVRLHLARLLGLASQFAKAIRVCEPLLRDQVRVLGPEHDDTLETRQLLANLRYKTGDVEGAIKELEQLQAALLRTLMPTHNRITKLKRDIDFLKRST